MTFRAQSGIWLRILETECFFCHQIAESLSTFYKIDHTWTIETATIQPNNHYPISLLLFYYIKEKPATLISVCCFTNFSDLDIQRCATAPCHASSPLRMLLKNGARVRHHTCYFKRESRTFRPSVWCIGRLWHAYRYLITDSTIELIAQKFIHFIMSNLLPTQIKMSNTGCLVLSIVFIRYCIDLIVTKRNVF